MTEKKDIECSNCNKWLCLIEYVIDDPASYECFIQVECPYCGDKSWKTPIRRIYKLGLNDLCITDVDDDKFKEKEIYYVRTARAK